MAQIDFGGVTETVVTREEFPLSKAREVLKNEVVAVIGYGVQGPAQAMNMKDNGINVIIGQAPEFRNDWDRAVADGATLMSAGERRGAYFPPGVLTNVSPDSVSYKEELFGPVATVYKVGSEDEAVALANDTPFGLGSYVFTTDAEQAKRVADKIDAGMVFVNAVGAEGAELPFGGVKRSGFGRELGRFGIDEFVNKKLIRIV